MFVLSLLWYLTWTYITVCHEYKLTVNFYLIFRQFNLSHLIIHTLPTSTKYINHEHLIPPTNMHVMGHSEGSYDKN
jgi:hypothetical protein